MKKTSIIIFTVLLALLVFVSCDQSVGDLIGFNVSFNANGGTGTMDTVFVKGSVYEAPANGFARDGYTFTGWNTLADGSGTEYKAGAEINGYAALSITLFAQWQANTYNINITQVANGSVASLYDKYTVKEETVSIPLSVLADTGYRLSGYEVQNASIDGDYLVISAGTYGNITIIPSFAANDYSVRFNANSGSGSMDDQDFTFDKAQTLSAVGFTKTGYTFAGWNTSEGGSGEAFDDKESVVNLTTTYGAVVELYAQWTVNTYTVDFRSNDGAEQVVYEDFTYDIAQNLTVNTFKRTGYTFASWNTEADGSGTAYADGALVINLLSENEGKMPLFAQWDAHTYVVRFYKNAEDAAGTMADQSFTYDEAAKALSANGFTRTGYTFAGWNTAADASGKPYADKKTVSNLTAVDNGIIELYACWDIEEYDVSVASAEHGSVIASSSAYSISDSIQTITLNVTPDKGYKLTSLTATAPATVSGSTLTIPAGTAKDITVTATFAANEYSVRFYKNAEDATGMMFDQDFTYDAEPEELTANAFERTGYTFAGWSTAANGNGYKYIDKATVSNLTEVDNGIVELYARWYIETYDVSVAYVTTPAHGSVTAESTAYSISESIQTIALNITPDTGYELSSLTATAPATVSGSTLTIPAGTAKDITVTATFAPCVYNVSFNVAGGEINAGEITTYTYGTGAELPTDVTKDGNTFEGWWDNPNYTGAKVTEISTTDVGDKTFYAMWNATGYEITFSTVEHGSASALYNEYTINEGVISIQLSANPAKGYELEKYTVDEAAESAGVTVDGDTLIIPAGAALDIKVTPHFTLVVYTIKINKSDMGSATSTASGYEISAEAKEVTLTATPKDTTLYDLFDWDVVAPAGVTVKTVSVTKATITIPAGTVGDISITPVFLPKFKVTLNKNGGTVDEGYDVTSYFVAVGATLPTSDHFKNEGNVFDGWYANSSLTGDRVTAIGRTDLGEKEYWAKWIYSISYNANNATSGSAPASQTNLLAGQSVTLKTNTGSLAKTGYTFNGWNTKADGSGTHYNSGATVTDGLDGNTTLYAEWKYTITYAANGATSGSVPTAQTPYAGNDVTLATNTGSLARTGYTFNGWNTAANGSGTHYDAGAKVEGGLSNTTLYAEWTYTIAYNANGATSGTAPDSQTGLHAGVNVTLKGNTGSLARTGYTFNGWNTKADGSGTHYDAASTVTGGLSEKTLYAEWIYTIAYSANGATSGSAPTSQTGLHAGNGIALKTNTGSLAKTGYTFNGWNTKSDGTGTHYGSGATVTGGLSEITLYAEWTYTITYNGNSATSGSAPAAQSGKLAGKDVTLETNSGSLARTGYTFGGWNTKADGSGTHYAAGATVTGGLTNTTLYAEWKYTIAYNANGAETGTAPSSQTGLFAGNDVTLRGNTGSLAKTGYNFTGWNTKADGTGTHYDAAAAVTGGLSEKTLYAEWTIMSYTLTFAVPAGYTVSPTEYVYEYNPDSSTVITLVFKNSMQQVVEAVDWHPSASLPGSLPLSVNLTQNKITIEQGAYADGSVTISFTF